MRQMKFAAVRDAVLLALGVALIGYEALIPGEPRILLVSVALILMGVPATLTADRWFVRGQPPAQPPADPSSPAPDSSTGSSGPTP